MSKHNGHWTREKAIAEREALLPLVTVALEQAYKDDDGQPVTLYFRLRVPSWKQYQATVTAVKPPAPISTHSPESQALMQKAQAKYSKALDGAVLVKALQDAGEFVELEGHTLEDKFADLSDLLPPNIITQLEVTLFDLVRGKPGGCQKTSFRASEYWQQVGRILTRHKMSLKSWKALAPDDEAWYLAHDRYLMQEIATVTAQMSEQKAHSAETVLTLQLLRLGVI